MRYDDSGALKQLKVTADGTLLSETHYAYDDRDRPATTTLDSLGGGTLSYAYIGLGRLGGVTQTLANSGVAETEYAYLNYNSNATSFVSQMTNTLPGGVTTYGYTYKPGSSNIATIKENNVLQHTYTYDSLGQLTKDITPGKTMDYAYDVGGNITSIKENNVVTRSFAYDNAQWKDQLTAIDKNTPNEKQLTYDAMGNLKTYDGFEYTWQKGGQLAGISSSSFDATYKYDYTGLRASKTVDNVTAKYLWAGDLLMSQSDGTNTLSWSYGPGGGMIGFALNGVPYFYLRNLQGDVTGIYDEDGVVVAKYSYDAWGNILDIWNANGYTVGDVNPIRYRGYYWDVETGYYYCQSRYYNPEWCRWISSDAFLDTGDGILSTNMYAYCHNDPVNLVDPGGMATWWERQGLGAANEIHNVVVNTYVQYFANQGYAAYANQALRLKDGSRGYSDVLVYRPNMNTAFVWEVKSMQKGLKELEKGRTRMLDYIAGKWNEPNNVPVSRGWGSLPEFDIIYTKGKSTYYISTYDKGQGLIGYTYTKMNPSEEAAKEAFRKAAVPVVVVTTAVAFFWPVSGVAATAATVIKALEMMLAA